MKCLSTQKFVNKTLNNALYTNVLASNGDGVAGISGIMRNKKVEKMTGWLNKSEGHGTKENSQVGGMRRLRVISSYVIRQTWVKTAGTELKVGEEILDSPRGKFKKKNNFVDSQHEESHPQVNIQNGGMIQPKN